MEPIEFEAELSGGATLALPPEVAKQLPSSGRARVILLVQDDPDDGAWRQGAYEQFVRHDEPEDAVYDGHA
jgi:hypothetical protein